MGTSKKPSLNLKRVEARELIKFFSEILECYDDNGLKADIIAIGDDLLLIEFPSGQRYRILIQDCARFS